MAELRLARYVTVEHPDTGVPHKFGPNDDVPDWAEKLITNPSAWALQNDDGEQVGLRDALMARSRTDLLKVLEDELNLVPGEDFPASAGKGALADLILKHWADRNDDEDDA